ncbi:PREDICTED: uncharacterized protein LOC107122086 isoform X2 [Gekko japonicus]|uniref:Uncharacterized protein LOC107122086 isoform X2 n=1 Tax=Gekko japonicus TaxID=146911 RepID=A0ABM1L3R5_GEKJA|nr:PREDICTED: uncharacterized protein LOC107122086 isoform X2 [Gekko japonicus]
MEEAPRGTFQDELEWCISQLETGLLNLHPTPEQVEDSQRILRVLRSRKAPSVKKRQMMHQVFGDYRLKMAEERKRTAEAAVKSEKVQIQPGDAFGSGSVVYRKQSGQPSEASSWFAPSDNSFQFGFDLPEGAPEEMDRTTEEAHGVVDAREQSAGNIPSAQEGQRVMLHFSPEMQGPEFAFNFIIPGGLHPPAAAADPSLEDAAEAAAEKGTLSRIAVETLESSVSSKPSKLDAGSGRDQRDDEDPSLAVAQEAVIEKKETTHKEVSVATACGSSKRKKRKKQPSRVEPHKNVNEDSRLHVKAAPDQTEPCQPDEQVKREVEWCVEQLELGLKTQKSTPKQRDEALRAIKTLRSEKAVLAKKRQIMRLMFGDYRKKMAEERQKQLKSMQAASKAARITEVPEDARRKSSQVFRKSTEVAGKSQNSEGPLLHFTRTANACSFRFMPSQEEFQFNFF